MSGRKQNAQTSQSRFIFALKIIYTIFLYLFQEEICQDRFLFLMALRYKRTSPLAVSIYSFGFSSFILHYFSPRPQVLLIYIKQEYTASKIRCGVFLFDILYFSSFCFRYSSLFHRLNFSVGSSSLNMFLKSSCTSISSLSLP